MKLKALLIVVPALLLIGCGKPISGKVSLTGERPIPLLTSDGKAVELGAGDATVQFKARKTRPRILITSAGEKVELKLPKGEKIPNAHDFYLKGEDIEQPVDLEGRTVHQSLGTETQIGTDRCYAPGFCYGPCYGVGCSPYPGPYPYPGGPGHPGGGYSWRPDCPGVMTVQRTYEKTRELFSIAFRDANSSGPTPIGTFEADRGLHYDLKHVQPLSGCDVF